MKLQNIFIQTKIKELIDTQYSSWNDSLIIKLCHYSVNEEFKKYKSLLKLLFQDFLIDFEQKNKKNTFITFTKEELYTIQKKLNEHNDSSSNDQAQSLLTYLSTIKNEKEKLKEEKLKEKKLKSEILNEEETQIPKKYINNLHDAEIFTNDEYIIDFKNQGLKYIVIFLGILIIIMTYISKNIDKLRNFSSYGNHMLSNQYHHMQSLLQNKLMDSLLEKNNFKDLFSSFSENKE